MAKSKGKPEAFVAEFEAARWGYLLARDMEWAYRHIDRMLKNKHKQQSPEEILATQEKLKEITELFNKADEDIRKVIEEIKNM